MIRPPRSNMSSTTARTDTWARSLPLVILLSAGIYDRSSAREAQLNEAVRTQLVEFDFRRDTTAAQHDHPIGDEAEFFEVRRHNERGGTRCSSFVDHPVDVRPRAETPTHFITMGLHESLDEAARRATREMIDYLVTAHGLSRDDAYMLTSAAADLHVTQVVDGVKGVHAMLPKSIFRAP